jgi:16S rRNA (adenine1518-N6/adenine1519-N6)-dimethyltransferase
MKPVLNPFNAKRLLKQYGLQPKKRLGQNFLIQPDALRKVVEAASLGEHEQILEIGAGLGVLTIALAELGHTVVAVEYDRDLIPILRDILAGHERVSLIHGDILALEMQQLMNVDDYLVVANIPYQITSALIRRLMESSKRAKRIVLTIQREVAERIVASPGQMSLLALSVQLYGEAEILSHIPASAFYPEPKVQSSVLRIDVYPHPKIQLNELDRFFRMAKAGFSQKRKQLRNALSAGLHLEPQDIERILIAAGVDPTRRAQELSIREWQQTFKQLKGQNNL